MKTQDFAPTPAMQIYAFHRSRVEKEMSDRELAGKAGVRAETVSRWKKVNGFSEWLEEQMSAYRQPIHDLLEQVARERIRDFRFWEALATRSNFTTSAKTEKSESRLVVIFDSEEAEELHANQG